MESESQNDGRGWPLPQGSPAQGDVTWAAPRLRAPAPPFDASRGHLPEPVLPAYPAWVAAYWDAWSSIWDSVQAAPAGSPLPGPILSFNGDAALRLHEAAVVARLAGYARVAGLDLVHLIDNFYASQTEDGFIPGEVDTRSGQSCYLPFDPNGAGPNLLAWVEWRHFRLTGDEDRLRQVFRPAVAYHRWLRRHRTWQSGLYWTTGHAAGDVAQSAVPDGAFYHEHWSWLDATLQANVSGLLLGRMAELLGETAVADELAAERSALGRRVNADLWSEDRQFYFDADGAGDLSQVVRLAAYWALLDRQLVPEDRRRALIQLMRDQHNSRRRAANGSEPANGEAASAAETPDLPTLTGTALDCYVTLRGLQTAGAWPLAHDLGLYALGGDGFVGKEPATPRRDALFLLVLLEQVIGVSLDWPLKQVTWRNYLGHDAETGVRRLALGMDGTVDLLAAQGFLTVRTDAPFTLTYRDRQQEFQSAVPAGVSTFDLS